MVIFVVTVKVYVLMAPLTSLAGLTEKLST